MKPRDGIQPRSVKRAFSREDEHSSVQDEQRRARAGIRLRRKDFRNNRVLLLAKQNA